MWLLGACGPGWRWARQSLSLSLSLAHRCASRVVSPPTISTTTTTGLSDPYCYLWIAPNDSKSRLKTKIMFKTLDPVWNETFELYVSTTRANSSSTNSLID